MILHTLISVVIVIVIYSISTADCYTFNIKTNGKIQSLIQSKANEAASVQRLGIDLVTKGYYLIPTQLQSNDKRKQSTVTSYVAKGRSDIIDCVKVSNSGNANTIYTTIDIYKAKITQNKDRHNRELLNYNQIVKGNTQQFIQRIDYNDKKYVFILEAGIIDLKQFIFNTNDRKETVRGKELKNIVKQMALAVKQVHSQGYVWTDVKLDNFVLSYDNKKNSGVTAVLDDNDVIKPVILSTTIGTSTASSSTSYTCKAIDLESCVRPNENLIDFSPETADVAYVPLLTYGQLSTSAGRSSDFKIDISEPLKALKAADIWSLGIVILHLYTGVAPIVDRSDVSKAVYKLSQYRNQEIDLGIGSVEDVLLKRLLMGMMTIDPSKRCSISNVLSSLYLLT